MKERRKSAREITPEFEDSGIFNTPLKHLLVEVVPKFGKNSRLDVMVKGFIQSEIPIDVVFPGRRKFHVEPLVHKLHTLWTQANRKAGRTDRPPEIDEVRLPVRIEGSWRPRFQRDDQGWQTRTHQLFAARWIVADDNGEAKIYGEEPVRTRITDKPAVQQQPVLTKRSSRPQ